MKKILGHAMLILSVLSLILFVVIAWFRWPIADDFVFYTFFKDLNFFQFGLVLYQKWAAKFMMPSHLVWMAMFQYLDFKVNMVIASLTWVGSCWFAIQLINRVSGAGLSLSQKIIATAVFNYLTWILCYDFLHHCLYWLSATVYIHSNMIVLAWLFVYESKIGKRKSGWFHLFTIIAASTNQNAGLGVFFMSAVLLMSNFRNRDREGIRAEWLTVLLAGISVVICTLSAGSFVQYNKDFHHIYGKEAAYQPVLMDYIKHFFIFYIDSLKENIGLFLVTGFGMAFLLMLLKGKMPSSLRFIPGRHCLQDPWRCGRWFIMSFLSLAIYWPTLLQGGRYYVAFYFFLPVAITLMFYQAVDWTSEVSGRIKQLALAGVACLLILASLHYYKVIDQTRIAGKFLTQRNVVFMKDKNKEITVNAIDFTTFTRAARSFEINNDHSFYINMNYREYYHKDSIHVKRYYTLDELKAMNGEYR